MSENKNKIFLSNIGAWPLVEIKKGKWRWVLWIHNDEFEAADNAVFQEGEHPHTSYKIIQTNWGWAVYQNSHRIREKEWKNAVPFENLKQLPPFYDGVEDSLKP
jgi:hypothetical protein